LLQLEPVYFPKNAKLEALLQFFVSRKASYAILTGSRGKIENIVTERDVLKSLCNMLYSFIGFHSFHFKPA
jgi:hypothetical protein